MKTSHYLSFSFICLSLLSVALWLQHHGYQGVNFAPCPLCVLQRIGYLGMAASCLLAASLKPLRRLLNITSIIFAGFGLSVAARHLWVIAHPETICGLDPLEVFINQFGLTQSVPWFFKADGFCTAPLPPLLGVSIPVWSFVWLAILLFSFCITLIVTHRERAHDF